MKLSFVYLTNRIDPKVEWFYWSLASQLKAEDDFEVILVDFFKGKRALPRPPSGWRFTHVSPKPSVWQGEHRLTTKDYFAASNARNTGLCLARGEYICYVDDLSVLMPGYMQAVREAMQQPKITLGAYRKVLELTVEPDTGVITHFKDNPIGHDCRVGADGPVPCLGRWHYGCSIVAPTEYYLEINGWPEGCDGLGYEDCICGTALANSGRQFQYDRRMMTWESEELHHSAGASMERWDKGKSPNDKSHAMMAMYRDAKRFENYFGSEGIRGLRARVLSGEPFPVCKIPEHDWFDGQPLKEM